MAVKLTESRLRQIIREEAGRLLSEAGPLAPMPGSPMSRMAPRGPADTFLIYAGGRDPEFGGPSGMLEYYIGTRDDVEAFAAGEPVKLKPAPVIGTKRQWDNHMNGGPNPIAMWLKKHPEIKYIMDQDHPDPFGSTEFFDTADWIAEQEDAEFHG